MRFAVLAGAFAVLLCINGSAYAWKLEVVRSRPAATPWHGGYSNNTYGAPVALVVPPTAERQTHWGWGVGSTRVTKIPAQYQQNYPGPGNHYGQFQPTPPWPSNTDQMGVYPVRAPW